MKYGLEGQLVAGADSLLLLRSLLAEVGMAPGLTNRISVLGSQNSTGHHAGGFDVTSLAPALL